MLEQGLTKQLGAKEWAGLKKANRCDKTIWEAATYQKWLGEGAITRIGQLDLEVNIFHVTQYYYKAWFLIDR